MILLPRVFYAFVSVNGTEIDCKWNQVNPDVYQFRYRPTSAGVYDIKVLWNGKDVPGKAIHVHAYAAIFA